MKAVRISGTTPCPGTRGFTLIELLVTLTIFAAAMTALVGGMRSGIRTWRLLRSHQIQEAALQRAFDIINADFRHVTIISEEIPPLVEQTLEEGGDSLTMTVLGDRRHQRAGLGAVWSQIEYRVVRDEASGSGALMRSAQPYVGANPMGRERHEEQLLDRVERLRFDYGPPENALTVWEDTQRLPAVVTVTVERENGGRAEKSVWVPGGALAGRGDHDL